MKTTILEYLEDTYKFESTGTIIETGSNDFGEYIILDSTIFYPQGGGQPSDVGTICLGENIFKVINVRLDENGIVYHYGEYSSDSPLLRKEGQGVALQVNSEVRIQNAKNHTAGHVIDIAVKNIGLNITPSKGFHFNSGPYVEYIGSIEIINEGTNREDLINKLNSELEDVISQDIAIKIENSEVDISNPDAPEGKSYRFVYLDGYKNAGCGCGGTHLASTGELGKITITKIRVKKGNTKISYFVG